MPIVGVGASAGGLEALQDFLQGIPTSAGLCIVIVTHMDPKETSYMAELLARSTDLQVEQVKDGVRVEPNHVYVIPPGRYMAVADGALRLSDPPDPAGRRTPIDYLFHSLAESRGERSICVILSGTGTDGTAGLKAIKGAGGTAIVQDPFTARYPGMPESALATGLVDHSLPAGRMGEVLASFVNHPLVVSLDAGFDPAGADDDATAALRDILTLLRTQDRLDFRRYKAPTLLRRIQRRMGLAQIDDFAAYLDHLRADDGEREALARDMLISVTGFFRTPEAWKELGEKIVPALFRDRDEDTPIRIWIPGCATGEEVYSLAILLAEVRRDAERHVPIQIFATDINEDAMDHARRGVYAEGVVSDVSPSRLERFFTPEDKHFYRIRRELRDLVIFTAHDVLADPPFSQLDLISCRNLMIYLGAEAQTSVLSLFHYALRLNGCLFLGPSEGVSAAAELFEPVSKRWRIFRKVGPSRLHHAHFPTLRRPAPGRFRLPEVPVPEPRLNVPEIVNRLLLQEYAPPCVVVDRGRQILFSHGRLDPFLEWPRGEPTVDLMTTLREGLRSRLRGALASAIEKMEAVVVRGVRFEESDPETVVDVDIKPVSSRTDGDLFLVSFRKVPGKEEEPSQDHRATHLDEPARRGQLERELAATKADLERTIDALESSNEELKTQNEEITSMNEELQSANEELQTSQEELQSLNEELTAVNRQLEEKINALEETTNDLLNLQRSTQIPTLFLDRELCIQRFVDSDSDLFSLRLTDVGRPVSQLGGELLGDDLEEEAREVLQSLASRVREVQAEETWYRRQITPYRTFDERIEGVVVTYADITSLKRAQAELKRMNERLEQEVDEQTADLAERAAELRRIASTASKAEQAERRRIATWLHRNLQQLLVALKMKLSGVPEGDDGKLPRISEALDLVDLAIDEARDLGLEIYPPDLFRDGLPPALTRLAEDMGERHGLDVEFDLETNRQPAAESLRFVLYEAAEELLFNVVKHTDVRSATLRYRAREDGMLILEVADPGGGFEVPQFEDGRFAGSGTGLFSIQERIEAYGGNLELESEKGRGTMVRVVAPLEPADAPPDARGKR